MWASSIFFYFHSKVNSFLEVNMFAIACIIHDHKCHQAVNQLGPIFIFHILHSFYHMNFKTFKPFSSFLFYFVFKLYINLIFTACACPLLLLEACNPNSPWGIAFSTSYIGEVFNAFTLGPHNMLAVMVIKSSMDKDGNQNKVFWKFHICIILFELAGKFECIMTSLDL